MKKKLPLHLLPVILAFAPFAAEAQSTYSLIDNTNPDEVLLGMNDGVTLLAAGETLYVSIGYIGGAIGTTDPIDYFTIQAMLLAVGGASSASFNFFTGTDTGSGVSGLTVFGGVSTGTTAVPFFENDDPSDPGSLAKLPVTATMQYNNTAGNPFTSAAGTGLLFIGITNTGSNAIGYYRGSNDGTPDPNYVFASPLDTGNTSLRDPSYHYNGTTLTGEYFNNHPYIDVTYTTVAVPEPKAAMLGVIGAFLLLSRGRWRKATA